MNFEKMVGISINLLLFLIYALQFRVLTVFRVTYALVLLLHGVTYYSKVYKLICIFLTGRYYSLVDTGNTSIDRGYSETMC